MHAFNDVHQQFAEFFNIPALKPYAYLLSKKLSEGHTCLHLDEVVSVTDELPAYYSIPQNGSAALADVAIVGKNGDDTHPFVLDGDRLYLQRYFRYETGVLDRIRALVAAEAIALPERLALLHQHGAYISALFTGSNAVASAEEDHANWQLAAAVTGILQNFTIITGGPGTGKTTTVAKLLAVLYTTNPALKVALAAPTGKAAARMAESLRNTQAGLSEDIIDKFRSLAPSTIHRLLKTVMGTPYFRHNHKNPLNVDVVIVDECSMIDVALFAKLLDAISPATRLILLGDKDQLASVEAGSLFGDLCVSQPVLNQFSADRLALINDLISDPVQRIPDTHIAANTAHPLLNHLVELRRSHRFTGHAGIGKFSKAVINNTQEVLLSFIFDEDEQVKIDTSYKEDLFTDFAMKYARVAEEKDIRTALRKLNDARVLCAIREGDQGLYATNARIEKYLHDKRVIHYQASFYENMPVILTRNYYEHGLFNGDTGILRLDDQGDLMAWFEDNNGELKAVMPGYLSDAEKAFAMTIHKSQGSEFESVLVVLPAADTPLLTRELLYTAVTRAKKRVYIQGSAETILIAAHKEVERASGIVERVRQQ